MVFGEFGNEPECTEERVGNGGKRRVSTMPAKQFVTSHGLTNNVPGARTRASITLFPLPGRVAEERGRQVDLIGRLMNGITEWFAAGSIPIIIIYNHLY